MGGDENGYPLLQIPVFLKGMFLKTWVSVEGRHHTLKKEGIWSRGYLSPFEVGTPFC